MKENIADKLIKKNTLREPSEKLPEITDGMWNEVLEEHRLLTQEYFEVNSQLSPKTIIQYISCMRHFFYWVHIILKDKHISQITKRDFLRYIGYLDSKGMSSSAKSLKKSVVSSLCNYIENVLLDEVVEYKYFRNFTKGLPSIPKNQTYEKIKITREEYKLMIDTLIENENYMGAAWVAVAWNVGARRNEIRQFKCEILDYVIPKGQNYVLSHIVRGKGFSIDGKSLKYMINMDALKYIRMWINNRGYDNNYIFTVKQNSQIDMISETWADKFCSRVLSKILGRRINPHIFKSSCISTLLEDGVDLVLVSKYIAQHNDISTTSKFYDLRDFEEEKNKIFK